METTTNYGLKKPAYEDGADVGTLNDNTEIIDAELKKAENHRADAVAHVTTLLNSGKFGTVYKFVGLTATTGKTVVKFYISATYAEGDTVMIDGTAYTLKTTDGSTLTTGAWIADSYVIGVADVDNKILYVSPSVLKNPIALTVSAGYGSSGSTVYDGSAAKTVTVPYVTFHTSSPTGTLGDGEIYCVNVTYGTVTVLAAAPS